MAGEQRLNFCLTGALVSKNFLLVAPAPTVNKEELFRSSWSEAVATLEAAVTAVVLAVPFNGFIRGIELSTALKSSSPKNELEEVGEMVSVGDCTGNKEERETEVSSKGIIYFGERLVL